jgi:hypothetical protein
MSPRLLQPTQSETSGASGSAAQSAAVPSVRPVGLAAGSLAAVGTEAGAGAIASLSVNPVVAFLLQTGASQASNALARYARFLDVSAFFPIRDPDADENGTIDYFGVRVRVNLGGLDAGDEVWTEASSEFESLMSAEALMEGQIRKLLLLADNVDACADAIERQAAISAGCGQDLEVTAPDDEAYARLARALQVVRNKADSRYLGLDLRADFGDPTLGAVPRASARSLFLGASAGWRPTGEGNVVSPFGVRGRLGLRSTRLDLPDTTHFAVDGGIALEASRSYQGQQLSLTGGLEFRYGSETGRADQFQTNFLTWRAGLTLPLTEANSVSVSLSKPLDGDSISPTFGISGDWSLLFPLLGGL